MKTVQAIIDLFGGIDHLREHPIHLESKGYMPLSIEWIGPGLRGGDNISVMHWYTQNSDVMRDPDLVLELKDGVFYPVSYQQDSLGLYQEAVFADEIGRILIRPKLARDLTRFSKTWSKNLEEQGFLKAAQEATSKS